MLNNTFNINECYFEYYLQKKFIINNSLINLLQEENSNSNSAFKV